MSNIAVGIYLPSGVNVSPEPIFIEDAESIKSAVGGYFDVVTTDCGSNNKMLFVGYVNDEGIIENLDYNYLATNLFRRELYGNCVVLWGLNEEGVYDGENHDIPGSMFEVLQTTLTESTALAYNMSVGMAEVCNYATDNGIADRDLLESAILVLHSLSTGNDIDPDRVQAAMGFMIKTLIDVSDDVEDSPDDSMQALNEFCLMMVEHFARKAGFLDGDE